MNIPPTVIKRAGTAASPRDSLHPHGLILCVPKLIIFAVKMPKVVAT
jgi:hypothetical protein